MTRALVVDADPVGRNVVRMALERFGLHVAAAATPDALPSDLDPTLYDVVAIDAGAPGSPGEALAQSLRASGWSGTLVLTTASIGAWSLAWLKTDLAPAAIFAKPLVREEVLLRFERLLPTVCDDDDELVPGWDGALRSERKRFARTVPDRTAALLDALHVARRTPTNDHVHRATRIATELARDAGRHRLHGLAEVSAALGDLVDRLGVVSDPDVQRDLDALADVLHGVPVDRVLAEHTIDDALVYRHETVVLLVHPDLAVLLAAADLCTRLDVGLVTARDVGEAARAVRNRHFDVILASADLALGPELHALDALRGVRDGGPVPLVLVAGRQVTAPVGDDGTPFLRLPLDEAALAAVLARLTRRRLERRRRALLLEVDEALAAEITAALAADDVEAIVPTSEASVPDLLERHAPDVVIADLLGRVLSGLEICRQVRAHPRLSGLPVVLVATTEDDLAREAALRVGADDLLPRPLSGTRLRMAVAARVERFRTWADVDPELGVLGRGAFFERVRRALATVGHGTSVLSVGLLDVRGWLGLVAGEGFGTGDDALRLVAGTARAVLGDHVDVGRFCGDQLAVLLPGESTASAERALAEAAKRIGRQTLLADRGRGRVTLEVAWGVAGTDAVGTEPDRLLVAAVGALQDRKARDDDALLLDATLSG
jgi:DNA-binding response OmpR family regulator